MSYLNNHYNKKLKSRARKLRTESVSKAEKRIWKRLLSRRQTGVRFLRQRPIDNYIVDFFAPEIRLIIEINGSSHFNAGKQDLQKHKQIENLGFEILYFSEGIILNDLDEVQRIIMHAIHCRKAEVES
ncbi:MAG: endonuclease domain-containing protein [Fluviicola sp.]